MYKEPELPPALDTPAFRAVWREFAQHRKEIRHPLTPTSAKRLLSKLSKFSVATAIKMTEHSIENGYQGIFELPEPNTRRSFQQPPAPRPASTFFCPKCQTQHRVSEPCPTFDDPRVQAAIMNLEPVMSMKEALKKAGLA